MRRTALLLVLLLGGGWLAADPPPPFPTKLEVGFAAGTSTGFGLSARIWPGILGVQVTGAVVNYGDVGSLQSLGIDALVKLEDWQHVRFYGYGGVGTIKVNVLDLSDQGSASLGLGLGTELVLADRVGLNFQAGLSSRYFLSPLAFQDIFPTGEIGLFYRL